MGWTEWITKKKKLSSINQVVESASQLADRLSSLCDENHCDLALDERKEKPNARNGFEGVNAPPTFCISCLETMHGMDSIKSDF